MYYSNHLKRKVRCIMRPIISLNNTNPNFFRFNLYVIELITSIKNASEKMTFLFVHQTYRQSINFIRKKIHKRIKKDYYSNHLKRKVSNMEPIMNFKFSWKLQEQLWRVITLFWQISKQLSTAFFERVEFFSKEVLQCLC